MFRYDKKRVNRDIDELKKMLALTKGVKRSGNSVSASFLREDADLTLNTPTTEPIQEPTPDATDKTSEMKDIEKAIGNSTITNIGPMNEEEGGQVVKGYVSNVDGDKALYFQFDSKESKPKIQTSKAITLDDDLLKSIEQISAYFTTWKDKPEL